MLKAVLSQWRPAQLFPGGGVGPLGYNAKVLICTQGDLPRPLGTIEAGQDCLGPAGVTQG